MSTESLVVIDARGRNVECTVQWSDPEAGSVPHIVVEDNLGGRRFVAKRTLGAWSEVPLETVAARLNQMRR